MFLKTSELFGLLFPLPGMPPLPKLILQDSVLASLGNHTQAVPVVSPLYTLNLACCDLSCSLVTAQGHWGRDKQGYVSFTSPGASLHPPRGRGTFSKVP